MTGPLEDESAYAYQEENAMKEFKVTYFFDEEHYIRRFIHMESQESAEELIQSERDQYISFRDSRGIYHELNTRDVRVIQLSDYHRIDKSKKISE
ncbi:DUF2188 domain-containing protein [Sporosarcina sp. ANT_H38]